MSIGNGASPLDRVVQRLENVRQNGHGCTARCPVHADRQNSLSVREVNDGRVLLHCFVGCAVEQIVDALGLGMADLFVDTRLSHDGKGGGGVSIPSRNPATVQPSAGCTVTQYGEAKQLPLDFLRSLGLADVTYDGQPAVRIPYLDAGGLVAAVQFRLALKKSEDGNDNRFRFKSGDKPVLYGLSRLDQARAAGRMVVVEGASDCHTLWWHGIPALGLPGAVIWREEWAAYFDDIDRIVIVIEPDRGGQAVRAWLDKSRLRERAYLVQLGEHKDPSALHIALNGDRAAFATAWEARVEGAISWTQAAGAEAAVRAAEAWVECAELAAHPRLLDVFAATLAASGVAGESRAAQLLYLILTSRLLDRPVSAVLKGPSSVGKSYLAEQVLAFFPASAYYALSAMSERALAYGEEPLSHRHLVIYEAAGLEGQFASYLTRSLLSEGRVRYETVEKTREGLRPRLIEREGPTGLLLTTTRAGLHPENETRLLSVPTTDTREQTQAVLRALANEQVTAVDLAPWQALQTWLEGAEHRVTIPYAQPLAAAIPPVAVRLRRDFGAVLNLIRAHAVLHQKHRAADAQGRLIATVEDYAVVRELVADLVADGVEATVSEIIRETVTAVEQLLAEPRVEETTVLAVAKLLKLDKSSASRRITVAVDRGYLKNLQDKKGRPVRIVLGEPLPAAEDILPTRVELEAILGGCTVAVESEGIDIPPSPADDEGEPYLCLDCGVELGGSELGFCGACERRRQGGQD
jgi:hypothetical protein